MKTIDELERELHEKNVDIEYAKAKAEQETKEVSNIAQNATKTIETKINSKIANYIDQSEVAEIKINQTAEKVVDKGLQAHLNKIETDLNKSEKDKNLSEFQLDEDAYRAFGKDTSPRENWKKWLIKIGSDFWFIVLFAICFCTIAPFYSFMRIIKTQSGILKFVAIATGVIMLLTILGCLTYAVLGWVGII